MKPSRTTIAGAAAGTFFAAAQLPGINPTLELAMKLAAAVAIAALGKHAQDCPANCPGSDASGRRLPLQQILFTPLCAVIVAVIVLTYCTGCVSQNPQAGKGNPPGPAYVVNPALLAASNNAAAIADTAAQVSGTGPALPLAVNGIFAAIGGLSLLWARHKSEVAATLAAGVTKAGPVAVNTVLTHASDSRKFAAVAQSLNEQLSAGAAPGQSTQSTAPN